MTLIRPQVVLGLNPRHPRPLVAAQKLSLAAEKFDLVSELRLAYFLAQLAHESGLVPREENLNYSAQRLCAVWPSRFRTMPDAAACAHNPERLANLVYGGRLGNTEPGDGWRYRGRGLIQLTGKANYVRYGQMIGQNLEHQPELLLQYGISALVAGAYWQDRNINQAADADDLIRVTYLVNGGRVGLAERRHLLALTKRLLI